MSTETQGGIPLRLKEPTVKLPKAVKLQLENVKRLSDARSEELKAALKEQFDKDTPSGNQDTQEPVVSQVTPEKTEVVAAPVVPEVRQEDTRDARYWEHRFKTNQGIHEAEKQRLKTQVTTLESRLQDVETQMKSVQRQAPAKVDITKYIPAAEIETYGKEMLSTVANAANHIAQDATDRRMNDEFARQIDPLKQKLEETEGRLIAAQQQRFWEDVDSKVPTWSKINDDPRFHEWLAQSDPFTGIARQNLLTSAQTALDANRVVAMFTAFLQTTPAPQRPSPETLAAKVVPDPIGQTQMATSTTTEVPSITRAEISQFYKHKAIGRYKFRQQEAEQIEKKIQAAIRAGTVT
jgi:hypothetical protein